MSENSKDGFVKPKRIFLKDEEYVKSLVEASLVKDLHDNEELCQVCHGTGMVIRNNVYGLDDDPDKSVMFPYMHQSISFCQHCYNGIVHRCKLCGELLPRGYLKHNCEAQRKLDREEAERKQKERLEKAPIAPPEVLEKCEMFFTEHLNYGDGYFGDWETFFDMWADDHSPEDPRPEYVWTTETEDMHIDADSVIESATEDLYEDAELDISDAKRKELQAYLNEFCKTCGVGTTYYQGKYKVRIPWEDFKGWEE